ncbi:MAG: hypothetical protein PHI05_01155 [Bacilli bacterium]|nr:hypothetical protein [Bacilli bacterium]MDD4547336.1 hypothetical protein [Bacilli bacterium]
MKENNDLDIEIIDISFDDEIIKPKNKRKRINSLSIGLTLLIIIVILFSAFYLIYSSPKRLLIKGMEKITGNLEYLYEPLISNINIEGNTTTVGDILLDIKLNSEEIDENTKTIINNLNKTKITYKHEKDLINKKTIFNILGSLEREELFNVNFYSIQNKQYLFLKNIYEKYIEVGTIEKLEEANTTKIIEEINYLGDLIKKSFLENLNEANIKNAKVNISINNKELSVKKITLLITPNEQKELYKKIIDYVNKDEKALDILKRYNIELKNDMDDNKGAKNIEFSVYYKDLSNEIVMMELINGVDEKIVYTIGSEDIIELFSNNKVVFRFSFKLEPDKFIINIKLSDNTILTINGEKFLEDYIFTLNLINTDYTIIGKFILNYETITQNIEYTVIKDFNIKVAKQGKELISIGFVDQSKISKGADIGENIGNTILVSELTEEEISDIITKISSSINKLMEA